MTPQQTWHSLPVPTPLADRPTIPAQRGPSSAESLASWSVRGRRGRWVVAVLVATAVVLVLGTSSGRTESTGPSCARSCPPTGAP